MGRIYGRWVGAGFRRTTSPCSSSRRYRSEAVKGRGYRIGPGLGPTPVLSPIGGPVKEATAGNWGGGSTGETEALLTAAWFEGGVLSEGDSGAGGRPTKGVVVLLRDESGPEARYGTLLEHPSKLDCSKRVPWVGFSSNR